MAATAAAKPEPVHETKASPKAAGREEPKPVKTAAIAAQPAPAPPPAPLLSLPCLAFPGAYSRLKRRPDQASASMLLHSIEAGLVAKPSPVSYEQPPASSDTTTDEPEDTAERDASRSAAYVPPPANEIVRNETIAAMTAPAAQNLSVRNKSVRQPEVAPLAAAALDGPFAEPTPVKVAQAAPVRQTKEEARKRWPPRQQPLRPLPRA